MYKESRETRESKTNLKTEETKERTHIIALSIVCSACLLSGCNTITRDMEKIKPQVADTYKDYYGKQAKEKESAGKKQGTKKIKRKAT